MKISSDCVWLHCGLFATLCFMSATGCGSDNPLGRQAISGRVTLDGSPLDQGTISFSPQADNGVSSGTTLRNGEYAIAASKGLPPGKYVVRIHSIVSDPANKNKVSSESGAPVTGLPGVERIPPAYNANSTLSIEVVAGRKVEFNFDLQSK